MTDRRRFLTLLEKCCMGPFKEAVNCGRLVLFHCR